MRGGRPRRSATAARTGGVARRQRACPGRQRHGADGEHAVDHEGDVHGPVGPARARRTPGCRRAGRRSTPASASRRRRSSAPSSDSTRSSGRAAAQRVDEEVVAAQVAVVAQRSSARRPTSPACGPQLEQQLAGAGGEVVGEVVVARPGPRRGRTWARIVDLTGQLLACRRRMATTYELSHLRALEAEAIHIFREVAAEFERPVLLFSGGKDSIVMLHLAAKAFWPASLPVPGHARRHRPQLRRGARVPRPHRRAPRACASSSARCRTTSTPAGSSRTPARGASRNRLQTVTLLRSIEEGRYDAVFGGARRDEEKARAKERVFSFRDEFGQWDPKNQRPELWSLYNGRHRKGEHIRVFPLQQLDRARHLAVHPRRGASSCRRSTTPTSGRCSGATGCCSPCNRHVEMRDGRGAVRGARALPHRRRRHLHRLRRVVGGDARGRHRRGRRHPPHRAGRDPGRRPHLRSRHGRPQEGGLLLMSELLRFATAGSVDDGKSTLIGRLLYDTKAIFEDQLEAVERTSPRAGRRVHEPRAAHRRPPGRARAGHHHRRRLPLLRHAEAQVHHRRHPGPHAVHAQHGHRRVDRRPRPRPHRRPQGRSSSSRRRHAFLSSLLGIPHLVLCVNKMDLVDWDQDRFEEIKAEFRSFAMKLDVHDLTFVPDLARCTATTSCTAATTRRGTRARRCCTTSRRCTSRRTATSSTPASRCST